MTGGSEEDYQSDAYNILGMPKNGSFAEFLCVSRESLVKCPEYLSNHEAAAIPLAGLTAYRALFSRGGLKDGDVVFISGFGGGVASMAFQFAIALGCDVYVSSSSESKRKKALELGAKAAVDYNVESFGKKFYKEFGGADVIIESAGGKGFNDILDLCKKGARIAMYGGTRGTMPVSPQKLFWRQISLLGTTMGSDQDFLAMVEFMQTHKIRPLVSEVFPLSSIHQAFELMANAGQIGKIVVDNTK